jgi:hypothetical protein
MGLLARSQECEESRARASERSMLVEEPLPSRVNASGRLIDLLLRAHPPLIQPSPAQLLFRTGTICLCLRRSDEHHGAADTAAKTTLLMNLRAEARRELPFQVDTKDPEHQKMEDPRV